jgi:hypothetical protein
MCSHRGIVLAMPQNRERDARLQIMLSLRELAALDDFRFRNRMPSRAAAIREILRRGLGVDDGRPASGRAKSSDFGVLEGGQIVRQRRKSK